MANSYDTGQASLYFQTVPASGNDLVSFYLDDFQLTYVAPPTIQTNIPSIYQDLSQNFPVGAAIDLYRSLRPARATADHALQQHHLRQRLQVEFGRASLGTFTYANADSRGRSRPLPQPARPRP